MTRPKITTCCLGLAIISVLVLTWTCAMARTAKDPGRLQGSWVDVRHRLNPSYHKIKRSQTRYIIVHTSELGLEATLRVVLEGKQFQNGRKTPGGHAHYVIARDGRTFYTLDRQFKADHAGLSMWEGQPDISRVSLGIELVGYHHGEISQAQYRSLGALLSTLKKDYGLKDLAVLTHSQVAYGRPNPWFSGNHRGRKRCARNFDRARAGLGPTWPYDPDVKAGRLMADPLLAQYFYKRGGRTQRIVAGPDLGKPERTPLPSSASDLISKENSAWAIAGDEYNAPTTSYVLPGGQTLAGDKVGARIGWDRLPAGTRVLLNQEAEVVAVQSKDPVKTITGQMTAWSHAGRYYKQDSTIYFLPSGRVLPGSRIRDWDDLPQGTRLVVGYKGPFEITKERTAFKIAGHKFQDNRVIYYLPGKGPLTGDKITDFANLPRGVTLYLPLASGS